MSDFSGHAWDEFVQHTRENTVAAMADSAYVISLIPDPGKLDVKFALELGAAIMLDKPMLGIAHPGSRLPPKLARVFDEIIEADVDTAEGREVIQAAIGRMQR